MPYYDFYCTNEKCDKHLYDIEYSFQDGKPFPKCPKCGSATERLFVRTNIILNGAIAPDRHYHGGNEPTVIKKWKKNRADIDRCCKEKLSKPVTFPDGTVK
jgi:putative FmdB family regulatory protein